MRWPLVLFDETIFKVSLDTKKVISVNVQYDSVHGRSQIVNAHSQEIRSQ